MNAKSLVSVGLVVVVTGGAVWWLSHRDRNKDPGIGAPATSSAGGTISPPSARAEAQIRPADPNHPDAATAATRARIQAIGTKAVHSAQAERDLIAALAHADQDVRGHACWSLGRLAPKTVAAVPALINAMADPIWAVRHNAAWALKRFPNAEAQLRTALAGQDPRRRVAAASALLDLSQHHADEVQQVLLGAYQHGDHEIRNQILARLGEIKAPSSEAVALVIAVVKDDQTGLYNAALSSLGAWGRVAAPGVDAVRSRLNDKDKRVRMQVAVVLSNIGVANEAVVSDLINLLGDSKDRPAFAAASALAKLEAFDALNAAQRSPSKRVRMNVTQAIAATRELQPRHVAMAVVAMKDADADVRLSGIGVLHGRKEPAVLAAIGALAAALSDKSETVAFQARSVLESLDADAARKALAAHPKRG